MPKAGVPQSRKRREAAAAVEESKRPVSGAKREARRASPLADFLRDPIESRERELVRAASAGELSTLDIQAALAAQIAAARKLLPGRGAKPSAAREAELADIADRHRPVHVLLKQLIEGLREVVMETGGGGGPVVVVELHWPEAYAGDDPGDDVRLRAPAEGAT